MSFTPKQRHQILTAIIDETRRLAKKFGFSGFADSDLLMMNSLMRRLDPDGINSKSVLKSSPDSLHVQALQELSELMCNAFGFEDSILKELKKLFEDKQVKSILAQEITEQEMQFELNAHFKTSIRDFIKEKLNFTKKCLASDQKIIQAVFSADQLAMPIQIDDFLSRFLKTDRPVNYKYHRVTLNSLYKLIKLLNTMKEPDLHSLFLPFFQEGSKFNPQIIRAFLAAEVTLTYFRETNLLTNILKELVTQDRECEQLMDSFIARITKPSYKSTPKESSAKDPSHTAVEQLVNDVLRMIPRYSALLAIIREDLKDIKSPKISELKSNEDTYLRMAFCWGFLHPLLAAMQKKLGKSSLSTRFLPQSTGAFDVMFGLKSMKNTQIEDAGNDPMSLLMNLASSTEIKEKVNQAIAAIGMSPKPHHSLASRSEVEPVNYDADDDAPPKRAKAHVRKRSQSFNKPSVFKISIDSGDDLSNTAQDDSMSPRAYSPLIFCHPATKRAEISPARSPVFRPRTQSSTSEKSAPSKKAPPLVTLLPLSKIAEKENTIEKYFTDLFVNDPENAARLTLHLVRPTDKTRLSWGIEILESASCKNNKQIAKVLTQELGEDELLAVFQELFRLEHDQDWGRGSNKLFYFLFNELLAKDQSIEFKQFISRTAFALSEHFTKIQLIDKDEDSLPNKSDHFEAKQHDIEALQNHLRTTLKTLFTMNHYPDVINNIFKAVYADWASRNPNVDVNKEKSETMRVLLSFIWIRFINPIIMEQAELQLEDPFLKNWYIYIFNPSMQFIFAPNCTLVKRNPKEPKVIVHDLFDPVVKDPAFRAKIHSMISEALQLDKIEIKPRVQTLPLDQLKSMQELGDLVQKEFSGLTMKPNGLVSPRSPLSPRNGVFSLFGLPSPKTENSLSPRSPSPSSQTSSLPNSPRPGSK